MLSSADCGTQIFEPKSMEVATIRLHQYIWPYVHALICVFFECVSVSGQLHARTTNVIAKTLRTPHSHTHIIAHMPFLVFTALALNYYTRYEIQYIVVVTATSTATAAAAVEV